MTVGYLRESAVHTRADGAALALETAGGATPTGAVDHPSFFSGFVTRPEVVSAGLLAVAEVAASRYFDLTAIRSRSLDPVVTASGDRIRFESFSADNGVHARLDLLSHGIDSGTIGFGTTNVDINPPLRRSLSRVGLGALVHLAVGADSLAVSTLDDHHIERAVEMPPRWIRGFAETPGLAQRMRHRGSLRATQVRSFIHGLPSVAPGPSMHIEFTSAGTRQSFRSRPGAVHLAGTGRLVAARRIVRHCTSMAAYGSDDGASGWVFDLPGARFTLLLSPEPYRGFSGEGALLIDLSTSGGPTALVEETLAWDSSIDPIVLAALTGLPAHEVSAAISTLATSGKVGFDLHDQSWFHRELPSDPDRALRDNPRLVAARRLVDSGAVGTDGAGWRVRSADRVHHVNRTHVEWRCSCLWWASYRGRRGPCSHVLAVYIVMRQPTRPTE